MIHITTLELTKLRQVGQGSFGTVFQKDDHTAYKVYHPFIEAVDGSLITNPSLTPSHRRLSLLKCRGKKLQYSDIFQDCLAIDGKFGGIVIPFYDGYTLEHFFDAPFSLKMDLSRQILRNGSELIHNGIYPLDFKLKNVMVEHGNIRIIDLDDFHTRAPLIKNGLHKAGTVSGISQTIISLFQENYYHFFGPTIADLLERKRYSYTYCLDEIAAYLDDKSTERAYLIIHDGSDIDTIKGLTHSHPYHIIYSHPKEQYSKDYFLYIIQTLRENGISLYDMTPDHFLDKMLSNFAVHDCIEVHGKQITKHI